MVDVKKGKKRKFQHRWVLPKSHDYIYNLINVLSSGCTAKKGQSRQSEMFLKMIPKVMRLGRINERIDMVAHSQALSQKFGISLKCDNQGKNQI